MTLRLYFRNETSPWIPPSTIHAYNDTSQALYLRLATPKSGTWVANRTSETNTSATWDMLNVVWISDPFVRGGLIPITDMVHHAYGRGISTGNKLAAIRVFYVAAPDGSIRGTWRADQVATPPAASGWGVLEYTSAAADSAPFQVYAGDRFVSERGARSTDATATLAWHDEGVGGTNATDLAIGDSAANAQVRTGWIEFTGVIETLWTAGASTNVTSPRNTAPIRRANLI